jgi:hypothetical protein
MSLAVVLKWIGIVDGVVVAAATALATAYPESADVVHTVIEVAGTISTVIAAYAHLSSGSASGGGSVAVSK